MPICFSTLICGAPTSVDFSSVVTRESPSSGARSRSRASASAGGAAAASSAPAGRRSAGAAHAGTHARSVLAGASELVVFVAEMEAHRLVSFASTSEVEEEGGLVY